MSRNNITKNSVLEVVNAVAKSPESFQTLSDFTKAGIDLDVRHIRVNMNGQPTRKCKGDGQEVRACGGATLVAILVDNEPVIATKIVCRTDERYDKRLASKLLSGRLKDIILGTKGQHVKTVLSEADQTIKQARQELENRHQARIKEYEVKFAGRRDNNTKRKSAPTCCGCCH